MDQNSTIFLDYEPSRFRRNQIVENKLKTLLVHRKGSTRAFPPHHPLIPVDYQVMEG